MRADSLNSENYPVRTKMTVMEQISTSHVCSTDKIELKEFLVDENLSQICSTDMDESKGIIVAECSTEEDETECVHKNIHKKKTQRMRQSMRNINLQMKCRYILTYSNVVRIF